MRIVLLVVSLFAATQLAGEVTIDDVLSGPVKDEGAEKKRRLMMVRQMALETGIAFGRNQFIREYRSTLDDKGGVLDLLDFSLLAIAPNVMPPVVVMANNVVDEKGGGSFHRTGRMYRIVRDAAIVSSYPTWRDYLIPQSFEEAHIPTPDIKLKTTREKRIWKEYAQKGIDIGRDIAKGEVDYGLAIMVRDYEGMLLAKYLERVGMIRFSVLKKISTDVINTGKALDMDIRYIRLDEDDLFTDKGNWDVFIREEDEPSMPSLDGAKESLVCSFWESPGERLSRWFGCEKKSELKNF